jgi:hypothetical protein
LSTPSVAKRWRRRLELAAALVTSLLNLAWLAVPLLGLAALPSLLVSAAWAAGASRRLIDDSARARRDTATVLHERETSELVTSSV